ncbi:MAG TPA: thiamine pyrophosphate-dependent enzyme [Balneolaceae bacterium]|nr:thiamine pyrophosphate-dependent enzyme [Balneolaceae bacterium]
MKLYEQLLKILEQCGVDHIYGVPGDAINPLVEAMREQDAIRFIHVTHEEAGALAASAEAKLTGNLAVCAGTVGPGAIHLLNGLYDAHKDYAPVLAITGQIPSSEIGSSYHQEVDLHNLFHDVALYSTTVSNPEQMPRVALEACNTSLSQHGVSVLHIPHDIGSKKVPEVRSFSVDSSPRSRILPEEGRINEAIRQIEDAENVAILAGNGCRNARDELMQLADHLKSPIIYSLKAKDIVPHDSPYCAGGLGLLGARGGVEAVKECDLLVAAGTDFPYREWYPEEAPVIRINIKGAAVGRRTPGDYGLIGDCKSVFSELLDRLKERTDTSYLKKVQKARDRWQEGLNYTSDISRDSEVIHPQAAARAISELADDDAVFSCDTGEVTVWAARHLRPTGNQRMIFSFNLASMAFAMPGAIGSQLAFPDRQIISLSGDGGFNMLMGDFLTAVKYNLPIKVFIFNNRKLGLIKMEQEVEGYPESETDLLNPDYELLAQSFGAEGASVKDPAELKQSIREALEHDGPYLLDIHINSDELTIPPKIKLEQAWGFGLSKIKEMLSSGANPET